MIVFHWRAAEGAAIGPIRPSVQQRDRFARGRYGPEIQLPGALSEAGRAAVFGDVNNDGGIDILVANNNEPARLLLNATLERANWIMVRLEGVPEAESII